MGIIWLLVVYTYKKNTKKNGLRVLRSKLQGISTPIEHYNLTSYFREGLNGICLLSNQNDLPIKFYQMILELDHSLRFLKESFQQSFIQIDQ